MIWLIDTNILLRLVEIAALQHLEARNAVDKLLAQGNTLCLYYKTFLNFGTSAHARLIKTV